jgi:AP endonuclease-2
LPQATPHPEEEALIAQAVAEADQERSEKRAEQNAKATPKWNELFSKKLPPLCTIHQKPCKDFSAYPLILHLLATTDDAVVKIPGPNKGKRFWLCSL